jgi:LuxR family transcriptional regulator, maltose regulon positive regulatory protein
MNNASKLRTEAERLIDRPVLRSMLDSALKMPLTVVVAQAGAGKTTLLRQWAATHPDRAFARLDIDEADDDPAHFARHLVAALAAVRPAVARVATAIEPDGHGLSTGVLIALGAALESMPNVTILVDNVHRFTNVRLVAELGGLVERLPHDVHLVLASRVDPPIALSRYRLHDEVLELRQAQLAFSELEAAALLRRIVGYPLTPAQVRALRERTEGWAAGLQLAGLKLRHEPDVDAFIADFRGSDRLVADYLSEEVLADLPAERRELLLAMSVLEDMTAGLVQAATGSRDAQRVLEELEAESMFLVPLDGRREWYRFHRLFSELLRSRMRAESPAEELRILTQAADWHLARGEVHPAMGYLARAQSWDSALAAMFADEDVSAPVAPPTHGGQENLDGQVDPAGPTFMAAHVLRRAKRDVSPEVARHRLRTLEADASRAGAGGPGDRRSAELAGALVSGGRALFLSGDVDQAREWLSRGLAAAQSDAVERVSALSALSLVEAWSGNIERADGLVHDALQSARRAGMLGHPSIADAYLASVLTAVGRVDVPSPRPSPDTYPGAVSDGESGAPDSAPPLRHPLIAGASPPPAAASTSPAPGRPPTTSRTPTSTMLFERALTVLNRGDTNTAREIVATWDGLVPATAPLSVVQNRILRARLATADGAQDEAARQLSEAVAVAEVHDLVDVFVQAGPIVVARALSMPGAHAPFLRKVRAHAERAAPQRVGADALAEPLTERELEILAYLPTRLTNGEVARRCFVSVNTIKTHMAHIYRKLDATDRDAAIVRARQLGLL